MAEQIQFDAPAGIVGLMAACNCIIDALVTANPIFGQVLTNRFETTIRDLESADEESHRLAAKVVKSLLETLQQSARAAQREPPAGSP